MDVTLYFVLECEDITEADLANVEAERIFLDVNEAVAFASTRLEDAFIREVAVRVSPEDFTH